MSDLLPRRELLRSAVVAGGATLLASNLTAAEEKKGTEKCAPIALDKATVVVPTAVGDKNISVNVSPDKLAQTILFDSLQADYGPDRAAKKFTPTKVAFLEIPVTPGSDANCELLGYTLDVRGHVTLQMGARASVTVVFGGIAEQIVFPFADQQDEDFNKRFFFVTPLAGTPGKTVIRSPLRIQVTLFVETATHDSAAVLSVEAMDVEARRAR